MKRFLSFALLLVLLLSPLSVQAASGQVTYDGNAGKFIFSPGSEYSPTDLFLNFKGVMPGDTITDKITLKNDVSHNVKVKLYLRSHGAHPDSEDFLSRLGLKVKKSGEGELGYLFDAPADEKATLSDWVYLGTLYSGGEIDLDVTLTVPLDLENKYQNQIGYLDWEFKAEELPIEEGDPKPPQAGDDSHIIFYTIATAASFVLLLILVLWRKKDRKKKEEPARN